MKAVDCRIVSREIDELDRGQQPSRAVREHTQACASCQDFYNDRLTLRQMVAGLGPVEAPADFDFKLRARLASGTGNGASRFSPGIFGFGFPSVALASIALLVGAGFFMRAFMDPTDSPPVVLSESPRVAESPAVAVTTSPEVEKASVKGTDMEVKRADPVQKRRESGMKATGRLARAAAGNRSQVATKDFSSNQAEVLKREDLLAGTGPAAVFPLAASEPLRVSVDYATGVSRTISLPTLSFGSQQVVSRGPAMIKTSARTDW